MRTTANTLGTEAADVADKPALRVLIARVRGFCAGVDRAIEMLDLALSRFGPPIYARHAIVHNASVVSAFEARGVIFVEELDSVPRGAWVVLSAHGVARAVMAQAEALGLQVVDATCPLVSKVHAEVRHHVAAGRTVLLIGHAGHPEVLGTMGQAPPGAVMLVTDVAAAERCALDPSRTYGLAMQTTLSMSEAGAIETALRARLPDLVSPARDDICYATTNRQDAVARLAPRCDAFIVVGGRQSSNSRRLVDTAAAAGCSRVTMIERAEELDPNWLQPVATLGVSSGASTPEASVTSLIDRIGETRAIAVEEFGEPEAPVQFGLPPLFGRTSAVSPQPVSA